jgi:hypothetical protein
MRPNCFNTTKIEMSERFENINGHKKKEKKRQTMIYITLQSKLKI